LSFIIFVGVNCKGKMLSNSSKYTVKAIIYIVNNSSSEHKLLVRDIAKETNVPKPYLSKLLQLLTSKEFLSSTKGPHGGVYLSEKQLKASLLDIIIETEGKDKLSQCAINFDYCNTQNPCPIHHYIVKAKEDLRKSFKSITLLDLREKAVLKKLI